MECKKIRVIKNIEFRASLTRDEVDFKFADSLDYLCVCVCVCMCVRARACVYQSSAN
jgi:hypothetical protein